MLSPQMLTEQGDGDYARSRRGSDLAGRAAESRAFEPAKRAVAPSPSAAGLLPQIGYDSAVTTTKDEKPTAMERLKTLLAEHGPIALWVYAGLFVIVLVGFATAIHLGWGVDSAAGSAGVWAGAYVATKLTQPLRIAATLALTPLASVVVRRFRR